MIHIYYGYGKGKTSAALGLGLRARGAKKSVSLVQFLKDNKSSELGVIPFEVFNAPESLPFNPGKEYQAWVDSAIDFIEKSESDVIILDEFLDIIGSFIDEESALRLITPLKGEVVITGHKEVKSLFDKADYLTHFDKIKHPYDRGVKARQGIEF